MAFNFDQRTAQLEADDAPAVFDQNTAQEEPPPAPTSWTDDVVRGVKHGTQVTVPKMVGQALQFFGADESGKKIIDSAAKREDDSNRESAYGQSQASPYSVRGNVYEAADNGMMSLAPGAAGAVAGAGIGSVVPGIGTAAGALIGYGVGSIASLPIFYGSQGQQSYENVKKAQLKAGATPKDAEIAARKAGHINGAIEAGGELIADVIPFGKLFKPVEKVGAKAAGSLVREALIPTVKGAAKGIAKTEAAEIATEMGQQAGQDYVEGHYGSGPGATWENTSKVIMPTALMTLIPGMAGAASKHAQVNAARKALETPDTAPEVRAKIAESVAHEISGTSDQASRDFALYAGQQIAAKQPIEIREDNFYSGVRQQDQAPAADPIDANLDEQIQTGNSPLSRAAAASRQADPVESQLKDGAMVERVRGLGPERFRDFLDNVSASRNTSLPEEQRAAARARVQQAFQDAALKPIQALGQQWQDLGVPDPAADLQAQQAAAEAANAAGQQWQDLGITDPGADLEAQRTASRDQAIDDASRDWRSRGRLLPSGEKSDLTDNPSAEGFFDGAPDGRRDAAGDLAGAAAGTVDAAPGLGARPGALDGSAADAARASADGLGVPAGMPAGTDDAALNSQPQGNTDESQAAQAVQAEEKGPQAPAAAAVARTQVQAPQVATPRGDGPAVLRKRRAQLQALADAGFSTIERRDDGFYMVHDGKNQEVKLDGPGDAQRARVAIANYVTEQAKTAAAHPDNGLQNPTPAQIKAGNYKKSDVIELNGMRVKLENPAGSTRSGVSPEGKPWSTTMAHHYGEFMGTEGSDGDRMDVFIGPRPDTNKVFVIDQKNKDGSFDEHKVMMGFTDQASAEHGYLANYEPGWTGMGAVTEMTVPQFKAWATSDMAKLPAAQYTAQQGGQANGRVSETAADAAKGPADRGAAAGDRPAAQGDGDAAQGLRDAEAALLAQRGAALRDADADADAVVTLSQQEGRPIVLAHPQSAATQALDRLLDVFAGLTGRRGIAIQDASDAAFDGAYSDQTDRFFVNVDKPQMHVGRTIAHEFKHLSEQFPGLAALYNRMWDLVPQEARAAYFTNYLYKGQDYARATPRQIDHLQREMMADFLGQRFHDRRWLEQLARQKPNLFAQFIREWIPLLDRLITELKGLVHSTRGLRHKDIDSLMAGYVKELEAMKALAMDVAVAWAERHPQMAHDAATSAVVHSARLRQWAADYADGKPVSSVMVVANAPSTPLRMAGLQPGDAIVAKRTFLSHLDGRGRKIDADLVGRAPLLLANPRAVLVSYEGQNQELSYQPVDGWQKRYNVISSQVDEDGRPYLLALHKANNVTEIVDLKTMFGQNNSLAYVLRAIQGGGFVWMPEKEVDRIKVVTGKASIASAGQAGPAPRSPAATSDRMQSDQRSTGGIVFSTPASVKFMSGADWRSAGVYIAVSDQDVRAAHGVHYSQRDMQDELQAELDAELRGAASPGAPLADVSLERIKSHGVMAEAAYPGVKWQPAKGSGGTRLVATIARTKSKTDRIEMNQDAMSGLWDLGFPDTWVGPAMGERDGYASQPAVQAFAQRQAAARDLHQRGFDLADGLSKAQRFDLVDAWKTLERSPVFNSERHRNGSHRFNAVQAASQSLKEIAADLGLTKDYDVTVTRDTPEPGAVIFNVLFTHKISHREYGAMLEQHQEHGQKFLTANTLEMGKGGLGAAFYQMAAEYAKRRNLPLRPESALSGINSYRRTEQMLSAALRTGKSNVMVPHPVQRVYGFEDKAVRQESHDANLVRLLLAGLRNARELVPGFDALRYSAETGKFSNADGNPVDMAVARLLKMPDARAFGLGRSTLARAVLTNQILNHGLKAGSIEGFSEPVLYSARERAEQEYQAVEERYRDTDQWLKAPNGKPTRLTERQWVQVRTPSFKAFFGDWEKHAQPDSPIGSLWSDDQVSKAVDDNGEPLVVYHGTDHGGFYAFREPGGERRGDVGIFMTPNKKMALSYIRRGRPQDITPPSDQQMMESAGFMFDTYPGRLSSKDTANRELFYYETPDGDEVDGFATLEDAVRDAVKEHGLPDQDPKSAVYAAFVNLRNPAEDDFEGALWSGSREHQWVVEVGGEQQYDRDGNGYFDSKEEAAEFARDFMSPEEIEEGRDPLDYVRGADDHWQTTDDAVREAQKSHNDSAIIRNVIDDGGGMGGYDLTPSDVLVAFKPNQIKSADFNTGEFGSGDDIRYSKRDNHVNPKVLDAIPKVSKLAAHLTPSEQAKLRLDTAQKMLDIYSALPSSDEMAAVAYAGRAKRFWYRNSLAAIAHIFGADGWRFTGLLAATSPQCSVEVNLLNALNVWKNWVAAGRPHGKAAIVAIMGRSVQGDKGEGSVMGAWINNAVSALEAESFADLVLSGPKVDSFMRNLLGHYYEVTNDAWMANYTLMDQKLFSGSKNKAGTDPGKGPGYLAMNILTRQAAKKLDWQPAEVQETVWSWAMSMLETMDKAGETRGSLQLLSDGAMTDEVINATPDFRTLFHLPVYADILEQSGYHDALETLSAPHSVEDHGPLPFAPEKMDKLLQKAGLRLEFLQRQRRTNAQVSWEARPGESTGVLPGMHTAPLALQQQYLSDIYAAIAAAGFYEKTGLSLRNTLFGPSAWQAKVLAGAQSLTRPGIVADNKGGLVVDPESRAKINVAASVLGIVLNQEGVYWHYPIYTDKIENANGIEINFGRSLTNPEMEQLYNAIIQKAGHTDWAPANTPTGVRVLNFSDTANKEFHKTVNSALTLFGRKLTSPLTAQVKKFMSDGDALENNWKENPNAEDYRSRISQAGRSDLHQWIVDVLQPAVDEVNRRYSQQHGWGAPTRGDVQHSAREPSAGRGGYRDQADALGQRGAAQAVAQGQNQPGAGARADSPVRVSGAIHYGKQAGLSILTGRMSGTGIRGAEQARLSAPGVDPRIKQRVYFYLPTPGGIPQPEIGLGGNVYSADLDGLYDDRTAKRRLQSADANAFERAVLDAGYRGYINPEQGTIVVLGEDVPVQHLGSISDFKQVVRRNERVIPRDETTVSGDELVRKPQPDELRAIIKNRPALVAAAPTFRLEYGFARVRQDQAAALDEVMQALGSSFRFTPPQDDFAASDILPNDNVTVDQTIDERLDKLNQLLACLG